METKEMEAWLTDMQEVQAGLYKKTEQIMGLATESKVNTEISLQEIRYISKAVTDMKSLLSGHGNKDGLDHLALRIEAAASSFQLKSDSVYAAVKQIPSKMSTEVKLRFEGRNKTIFLILSGSVLTMSLFIGLWFASWQQNRKLRENDIKYRYLIQHIPNVTFQADTLYNHDPKQFKERLEQMEYYQKMQQQAEHIAREKAMEAEKAHKENDKIKKKDRK